MWIMKSEREFNDTKRKPHVSSSSSSTERTLSGRLGRLRSHTASQYNFDIKKRSVPRGYISKDDDALLHSATEMMMDGALHWSLIPWSRSGMRVWW